ncbi:RING-H2 finger protein ATL39-like [Actinidia eriantha]|uniref:RING-H2 finger protein ATL39-like n=1 Tax=Actinidia eriantha TaxID=165200 RepID=UPI00259056B0|nr:RING-H2 finger protein ATL39-like [Actinidia eriantha]
MGDFPSPLTPPPPSPPPKSNLPMLYYGLVIVGTAAIILTVYNLIIIKWCTEHHRQSPRPPGRVRTLEAASSRSFDNSGIHLVSSFKYKKEQGVVQDQEYEECPVCLSFFEEGEEVRQLPRCKHSFHAPCIDMWLYSHFDCPVCRSPVEPLVLRRRMVADPSENSREGLLDTGILV